MIHRELERQGWFRLWRNSSKLTNAYQQDTQAPAPGTSATTATASENVLVLKRRYLASLPSHELVELIMRLDQDRDMPIFPLHLTPPPAPRELVRRQENDGASPSYNGGHDYDRAAVNATPPPMRNGTSVPPPPTRSSSKAPHLSFLLSPSAPSVSHPRPPALNKNKSKNANSPSPPIIRSPSPSPPFHERPQHQYPDYPSPPPLATGEPSAALARSSWDAGMPSYEEMICMALVDLADPEGCRPQVIFDWMTSHFPLVNNFRASAHQALGKTFKRGRLQKIGSKYRLNPEWSGGTTSRRTTRRPQAAAGATPPVLPFSATTTRGGFSASNANSWHNTSMPALTQSSQYHGPQRQPYPAYHAHAHLPPQHHQGAYPPPGVALLQAIAGINGMIDHDQEMHDDDREEEDHGDGDEDAEGEMEMEDGDGAGDGVTTEDEEQDGGRGEKADEEEEDADDEDGGDPQRALKASLLDLAAQLKAASAVTSSPASAPASTKSPTATTTTTT